jgi:hypothetical protein
MVVVCRVSHWVKLVTLFLFIKHRSLPLKHNDFILIGAGRRGERGDGFAGVDRFDFDGRRDRIARVHRETGDSSKRRRARSPMRLSLRPESPNQGQNALRLDSFVFVLEDLSFSAHRHSGQLHQRHSGLRSGPNGVAVHRWVQFDLLERWL